jgi:hypothetical protein
MFFHQPHQTHSDVSSREAHLVFLDTEFASFDFPYLLSIGCAVAGSQASFYAELSDPENSHTCSDFVRQHVFCHFEGGVAHQSSAQIFERFNAWAEALGSDGKPVYLISDAPSYDAQPLMHWQKRHGQKWTKALRPMALHSFSLASECPLQAFEDALGRKYREHHALDDALYNKFAFEFFGGRIYLAR